MGNWVIICHGSTVHDLGQVQVPEGCDLQMWTNEGSDISVAAAEVIVTELKRNPFELKTLQHLIDQAWPGTRWEFTHGEHPQWVDPLELWGDPDIQCVGALDLEKRSFNRWTSTARTTLKWLLQTYQGTVHLICCRS